MTNPRDEDGFGAGLRLLAVDDEPLTLKVFERLLRHDGFEIEKAGSLKEALDLCSRSAFDVALVDKNLPDGSGLDLAEHLSRSGGDCAVVIITGYASLESAIEAIQLQVVDYIVKPANADELRLRIRRVVDHLRVLRRNRQLSSELQETNRDVKRLREQVVREPLTGLFNHAYFQERLTQELSRSDRFKHDISLVFSDLDNFKAVNDNLGHMVGDQVLKSIAGILHGEPSGASPGFHVRDHDVAARYGGDEFVLLLPETPKAGATVMAERLRATIEHHHFGSEVPPVTLSLGVATFPEDGKDRDTLLNAADVALYAAKQSGRNRVVAYAPELGESINPEAWAESTESRRIQALDRTITERAYRFSYHPIVKAGNGTVLGYQSRCHPGDPAFKDSADLVLAAERTGKVYELGRLLRGTAVAPIRELGAEALLFLSLHPLEVYDPRLMDVGPELQPVVPRLVLEITRSRDITDQARLLQTMQMLRERGFRIGLDDLCPGYLGLNSLARLSPDFARIDTALLRMAQSVDRARRMAQHFLEYCRGEGIQAIATGIDSDKAAEAASELGFGLLQGSHYPETDLAP